MLYFEEKTDMRKLNFNVSQIYRLMGGDGVPAIELDKLYPKGLQERKQLVAESLEQYDPKMHAVTDRGIRKDKVVFVPNGQKDQVTGEDILVQDFVAPARAPIKIQKYIIGQKASFARGNGVKLRPSDETSKIFKWVYRNWYANKTDFYLREIAEKWMAETQVAVIFFMDTKDALKKVDKDKARLKFKILCPSKGDFMVPYFDPITEELTGLLREYEDADGKTVFDLYINDTEKGPVLRKFRKDDLKKYEEEKLPYPKLNLVYWERNFAECDDVLELINELESSFNDFLTQMGYSADPILFGKGKTLNLPAKGSAGKFIEGSEDSDLKFVTPDNATESRDLQFKLLQKWIFSLSRAVILDLDTMKNLSDVSGAALDRYLIDAYLEATDNQTGYWGLGIQRMTNVMVAIAKDLYGVLETDETTVDVEFSKYRINDIKETIELFTLANGNKPLIDHLGSISGAGLADDPQVAFDRIKQEQEEAQKREQEKNGNGQTIGNQIAQQRAARQNNNGDPAVKTE